MPRVEVDSCTDMNQAEPVSRPVQPQTEAVPGTKHNSGLHAVTTVAMLQVPAEEEQDSSLRFDQSEEAMLGNEEVHPPGSETHPLAVLG